MYDFFTNGLKTDHIKQILKDACPELGLIALYICGRFLLQPNGLIHVTNRPSFLNIGIVHVLIHLTFKTTTVVVRHVRYLCHEIFDFRQDLGLTEIHPLVLTFLST